MFKSVLNKMLEGHTLSREEAKDIMNMIMNGEALPTQIASFLSILRFRGETVDEMAGFVSSMKQHVVPLQHNQKVIDTCGTGGDGASTFNISTASAILLSSLGVKVAKHGNRAVSSTSGSADVLELLDIPVQATPEEATKNLIEKNMCFLFAPMYHVSMKHVAGPRKDLGFRTVFNILGPLANPANSETQLIGVYDTNLGYRMAETLRELGTERALFVTGEDGLDEISISSKTHIVELNGNTIHRYEFKPEDIGIERGDIKDIQVGSVHESASIIEKIFKGEANSSATNIVLLNTAAGLKVYGYCETFEEGYHIAKEAIENGTGYTQLKRLAEMKKVSRDA